VHTSPFVHALPSLQLVPLRAVQIPSAVAPRAALHAWQAEAPAHAVSQQTPSTQLPPSHCASAVQPPPWPE
jgi:hypothetical protein